MSFPLVSGSNYLPAHLELSGVDGEAKARGRLAGAPFPAGSAEFDVGTLSKTHPGSPYKCLVPTRKQVCCSHGLP